MNERKPCVRLGVLVLSAGLYAQPLAAQPAAAPSASAAPTAAEASPAPAANSAAEASNSRPIGELEAVSSAVSKNPTLHVALLQASAARYALRAEEALYVPIFSANAGITHSRTPGLVPGGTAVGTTDTVDVGAGILKVFPFGTTVSATVAGQRYARSASEAALASGDNVLGPGYSLLGQLAVTQPLLRGAGNELGLFSYRQAKLQKTAAELAAADSASALLRSVLGAYWELWYAHEAVAINEASRGFALVQQAQASAQVESGALARASALPYDTQVAELEEALAVSRSDERLKSLVLSELIAERPEALPSLVARDTPSAPLVAGEEALSEARVSTEALASSYRLRQLEVQRLIVKEQSKVTGDALRPRLDLDGYLQARGLGNDSVPPAFEQTGKLEAVSAHVGLTFEMPITDERRSAQIQQSLVTVHIAGRQLEAEELSIRSAVASALSRRSAAAERAKLSTVTARIAHEQAEAERARFLAGSSIAVAVQEAEESLRQAQLRAERAKIDLVLAELDLLDLRGRLLERYRAVLDRLPSDLKFSEPIPSANPM